MPLLSKKYAHDYSSLTKYTPLSYKITRVGGTQESQATGCKEITNDFYTELKAALREIDNTIVFDDASYKFTIWGRNYYCYCYMFSSHASCITTTLASTSYYNVVAPMIYAEEPITALRSFRWMTASTSYVNQIGSVVCPGSGAQTNMWTDPYDRNKTNYGIKIYYNSNFYNIQYISSKGEVVNLITIMKGKIKDNNIDIIYESPSPNNNFFLADDLTQYLGYVAQGTSYGTVPAPESAKSYNTGYHQIYRCDDKTSIGAKGHTSGIPGLAHNLYLFGLNHAQSAIGRSAVNELNSASDAIVFKPQCLGGAVEFDNLLCGTPNMNIDQCYNVDGNIYYCCGDAIQKGNEQYLTRGCLYPRFLLKL